MNPSERETAPATAPNAAQANPSKTTTTSMTRRGTEPVNHSPHAHEAKGGSKSGDRVGCGYRRIGSTQIFRDQIDEYAERMRLSRAACKHAERCHGKHDPAVEKAALDAFKQDSTHGSWRKRSLLSGCGSACPSPHVPGR